MFFPGGAKRGSAGAFGALTELTHLTIRIGRPGGCLDLLAEFSLFPLPVSRITETELKRFANKPGQDIP
jgi:hypothetical protein